MTCGCVHCAEVLGVLVADLERLRARVVLPAPRDALFDGEEVGRLLERGGAILERERVHVEGEIAALERAISLLRVPRKGGLFYGVGEPVENARPHAPGCACLRPYTPRERCTCGGGSFGCTACDAAIPHVPVDCARSFGPPR